MPISSVSNPPEPIPMKHLSEHWTILFTNKLLSSIITQPPTFISTTSQVSNSQPVLYPYTFNIPTCAPLPSQLQNFDDTDYRYRPEKFLNDIKALIVYQLAPESTNSKQFWIGNIRRMALVATSFDGPASSWFIGLSEINSQDWSLFSTKFLKQFDSATIKFKFQADARNF